LGEIKEAYLRDPGLTNLLLDDEFKSKINQTQTGWRIVVSTALQQGLSALAMSASLGYFDMFRTANLPLNLTQAQRDFFGSHTYERVDKPELGFVHTEWEELLEKQRDEQ
jgi:6-phosphogluconate dehydrogenase